MLLKIGLLGLMVTAGACSVRGDGLRAAGIRPGGSDLGADAGSEVFSASARDARANPESGPEAPATPADGAAGSDPGIDALAADEARAVGDAGRDSGESLADSARWEVPAEPEAGGEAGCTPDGEGGDARMPDAGREARAEASREAGRESGREAPREAPAEARAPECPAYCSGGCYLGCDSAGKCRSCASCECSGETGLCHC